MSIVEHGEELIGRGGRRKKCGMSQEVREETRQVFKIAAPIIVTYGLSMALQVKSQHSHGKKGYSRF